MISTIGTTIRAAYYIGLAMVGLAIAAYAGWQAWDDYAAGRARELAARDAAWAACSEILDELPTAATSGRVAQAAALVAAHDDCVREVYASLIQ